MRYLKDEYIPKSLVIDITTACSAKCHFCAREMMNGSRKNSFMEFSLFKSILDDAKKLGVKDISLYQTGEATLHPELDSLVKYGKDNGFIITLSTNGSDVDKYIETLLMVDYVRFSIDGWDKKSFELFRYPLKYEKIKRNLKLLRDAKNNSNSKMEIGINNIFSVKSDFNLFLENWAELIDYLEVSPLYPSSYFNGIEFIPSYDERLKEHYFNFEYISNEKKWCHFPFYTPVISYDGKMSLCCQDFSSEFNLSNVTDGLYKVFNSPQINKIRKEFIDMTYETCNKCHRFLRLKEEDKSFIKSQITTAISNNDIAKKIKIDIKV
ncbi:radical SAM/SPASM domain-containing protein [Arcobacter arenosus]|uniref:Radical SAM protein n=1 Tax=Arcobacter arenosus TaxID=2576037 RepID=A0A5R8Y107_9BACT|nr:radical SAM protein [Arcobacter arenosus]TLP38531.1 radical SAM protein [Arcobacter arenosus]